MNIFIVPIKKFRTRTRNWTRYFCFGSGSGSDVSGLKISGPGPGPKYRVRVRVRVRVQPNGPGIMFRVRVRKFSKYSIDLIIIAKVLKWNTVCNNHKRATKKKHDFGRLINDYITMHFNTQILFHMFCKHSEVIKIFHVELNE